MAEAFLSLATREQADILLHADYDAMRTARIVGPEAPEFGALLERIRAVEAEIDHWT